MHKILLLLGLALNFEVNAQTSVRCDEQIANTTHFLFVINGVAIKPNAGEIKIFPAALGLDTLLFYNSKKSNTPDTIYTKLSKNHKYVITPSCDNSFELQQADRMDITKGQYVTDPKTLEQKLVIPKETGMVKLTVKNKPETDTLVAIYTDFAGLPHGQLITENKEYDWLPPSKGYCASNNDYIILARYKPHFEYNIEQNDLITWEDTDFEENFEVIHKIQVRVFNGEKIMVEYDYLATNSTVRFEK